MLVAVWQVHRSLVWLESHQLPYCAQVDSSSKIEGIDSLVIAARNHVMADERLGCCLSY